jgi:predicted esterase
MPAACRILSPASATWDPRSILLLCEDPAFSRSWEPLLDEGWTLILARSIRWEEPDRPLEGIRELLEECARLRRITTEGMVIAGVAQGAPLAMDAACEMGVPWLCVIPSFPRGYDVSALTAVPAHTAGAVLLGEHDPAATGARAVIAQLEAAGVKIIVKTMHGAGHELPADFGTYAAEALRALLS